MAARTAIQFHDYKHKQHCRSCSKRGSLISPCTTLCVLSEDSGVGSEEDLAWDVQDDQTSSDVYSPFLNEMSRPIKQKARSPDELTGSLSIDCTIPLLVPPVQYQNEKQGADGEKEWKTTELNLLWKSRKNSNYLQVRDDLK